MMSGPDRDTVAAIVGDIVEWEPADDLAEKFSSASIVRVGTRDQQRFVVKHLPHEGDWLSRGTDGIGRTRRLWESGVLQRLPPLVDHAIVDCVPGVGGDVLLMRDVSERLVPTDVTIPPATVERLVSGIARMHGAWQGFSDPHCSVAARFGLFSPATHRPGDQPFPHPLRAAILEGWQVFADLVPDDVHRAVGQVHESPQRLADQLDGLVPPTLLHGDAKPENLGTDGEGLVAIDWGELTGSGPAETDLAWFAIQATWRTDALPDAVFDLYAHHADRPPDPAALDLACLGAMAQMGFKLALRSTRSPDDATRGRARTLLDWWVNRVDQALERTPVR